MSTAIQDFLAGLATVESPCPVGWHRPSSIAEGLDTNMLIGPQNSPAATQLARKSGVAARADRGRGRDAGRSEDCITLVAVSKGHGAEQVRAAAAAGVRDFGESYLQEALPKIAGAAANSG